MMALYESTNTRKTNFVLNLALLVDKKIRTIIYCYGSTWQSPIFDEKESMGVLMNKGLPEKIEICYKINPLLHIMIFDDLKTDIEKSFMMADCVKKNSHHMDVSIIILYQSLFPLGKRARRIRQYKRDGIFQIFRGNKIFEITIQWFRSHRQDDGFREPHLHAVGFERRRICGGGQTPKTEKRTRILMYSHKHISQQRV